MKLPETIADLLEERITFCQKTLQILSGKVCLGGQHESISRFKSALCNFSELQRMLALYPKEENVRELFREQAKAMIVEMIGTATEQLSGAGLFALRNNSLAILESLERIYHQVDSME